MKSTDTYIRRLLFALICLPATIVYFPLIAKLLFSVFTQTNYSITTLAVTFIFAFLGLQSIIALWLLILVPWSRLRGQAICFNLLLLPGLWIGVVGAIGILTCAAFECWMYSVSGYPANIFYRGAIAFSLVGPLITFYMLYNCKTIEDSLVC